MLLQDVAATSAHPLSGSVAAWMWLLPLLPLAGFVLNGALALLAVYRRGPADPVADSAHDHEPAHGRAGHDAQHVAHDTPERHKYAGIVSIIGPAVLFASFGLALSIFGE